MRKIRDLRLIAAMAIAILITLGFSPASATSANISHSYNSASDIVNGSLVSLTPYKAGYVETSNINNGDSLMGVAVDKDDSLLAEDSNSGTIQVATSGSVNALVSTLNGNIHIGDQISVSPFNGIGIRAISGAPIIGLAQTSFNSGTSGSVLRQLVETNGKTIKIWVGYIHLDIAVGQGNLQTENVQLSGLQKFSKNLTGHAVPTAHVVVSIVIAAVSIIAMISLIYASIYSGIISIGRNPLAKLSILKSMVYVLIMVTLIVIIAAVIIYLLLR